MIFFKKKKNKVIIIELADSVLSFIALNSKKALNRIRSKELKVEDDTLITEYMVFSIFTVDYTVSITVKDKEKKDLLLDLIYLKLKTYFDDENFKLLNSKLDRYSKVIRENKDWEMIVQKLGFEFSRKLLNEVDLILAMKIGIEFAEIIDSVENIIKNSKLMKNDI